MVFPSFFLVTADNLSDKLISDLIAHPVMLTNEKIFSGRGVEDDIFNLVE